MQEQEVVGPYVCRKVGLIWDQKSMYSIGLTRRDEMIAGVVYEKWNGISFHVHMVIEGLMTPKYLKAIFHYPFIHCQAHKVIAPICSTNEKSIRFAKNLGFKKEAQILDAHPGGDLLLFTMNREQFLGEWYGR